MKTKALLEHGIPTSEHPTDYETALDQAGQGKFQYRLMLTVGLYYIAANFEMFSISYLLPSAECDLRMTSHEKSILNSSPFVGTLIGACIWGKLADSWGRRSTIISALSTDALAAIISSFMQTFWPFVFFRFITGLTIMAAVPVCFPYMGEFHSSAFRSRALVWMEMFAGLGTILIPLVAWAIIPRPWLLGSAEIGFRYNSWRMFITASALPSVVCAIAFYFSPESPAFLLAQGKHDEALDVFKHVYHKNTGKSPDAYPVKRLEMDSSLDSNYGGDSNDEDKTRTSKMMAMITQIFDLLRPPLLKNTVIGLSSLFSLQLGFFGFGMWFPELFNRFEEFQVAHPNETATVCEVANMKLETPQWMLASQNGTDAVIDCSDDTIQPQVFVNTFSIGSTCILCALLTGIFVERIGRKRVIVMAMALTACCGGGSYFVKSAAQNLALSCFLQAFNGVSFSTIMSAIIEMYPATLRGLATTVLMNTSNVGSIVGNLLFGLLLDVNCAYPVFISAGVIAGQGKFQYLLMFTVGLYSIAAAFEMFSISYLLPSAECDLRMTSYEKGILNSSPLVGTLVGACIWGKLADSWGRRSAILLALSVDAFAAIISSFMQTFWPFVFFRFVSGLTITSAVPVYYPYLGEFHSSTYRSRALVWMEIFPGFGSILVPLVAWAIIPRPWLLGSAEIGFRYNSWRMFITASALPSVVCAIAFYFSPESPAFLLAQGKHDEALEIFKHVYHKNTGKSPDTYPVKRLEMNTSLENKSGEDRSEEVDESRTSKIVAMVTHMIGLFRPPLLKNTVIGLSSLFSLQLGFFGFGMWFPELFNRYEEFEAAHPNETATVCEVSNVKLETPQWILAWQNGTDAEVDCSDDTIEPQVFVNTFTIGSTCILCAIITGTIVEKIGRKRVLVMAMALTACCGAGCYFVKSAAQNLALSCFLQAFNGAAYSTLISVIIELYPASLRALATTILMNTSNVGAIVGNLLFGLLLDVNCAYPVFISAGVIAGCAVLCFFLPNNKNAAMS